MKGEKKVLIFIKKQLFNESMREFINLKDITPKSIEELKQYITKYIEDNLYEMMFEWADEFYSKRSSIDYDEVVESKVHIENDEVLKEM